MSKVLILAPHVDDETIGCFSVLQNPSNDCTVCYFYEVDDVRRQEAVIAADRLWFTAVFDLKNLDLTIYDQVFVPSRRDWHPDHKNLNAQYRNIATHFYSVDMANGVPLGDTESNRKREILNQCYPSQRQLWDSNAKYYLFEDIQSADYDTYMVHYIRAGDWTYKVTLLADYDIGGCACDQEILPHEMMNRVLALVPQGRVIVQDTKSNLILEAQA